MKKLKSLLSDPRAWLLLVLVALVTAASYNATDVLANRYYVRKDGSILGTNVTFDVTNSVITFRGSTHVITIPATGFLTMNGSPGVSVTLTNGTIGVTTQRMVFVSGVLVTNTSGIAP